SVCCAIGGGGYACSIRTCGRDASTMREASLSLLRHVAVAALVAVSTSAAFADGIEPGLWKIISRIESNGAVSPSRESAKCFTAEQARDLVATFSPEMRTINSECAPLESS